MASYRDARMLILDVFDDGFIDEEELPFLYNLNTSKNPVFPYESYERFELASIDEAECKAEFRFEKSDLPQLAEALLIPEVFKGLQRSVCDGMEGFCMLLRRLAYPCRYSDLIPRFSRPVPELSMITTKVADFIYAKHAQRMTQWKNIIQFCLTNMHDHHIESQFLAQHLIEKSSSCIFAIIDRVYFGKFI